jgi:3-oxoadipate CoA-transferase, alpha subunit
VIDKVVASTAAALAGVEDGATVMIGGFGRAGQPVELIDALIAQGAGDLTIVSNNAGNGDTGLAALLAAGRVAKVICSFPRQSDSYVFDGLYRAGKVALEVVPQGNLAERITAAGAGIGASSARPASAPRWLRAKRPAPSTAATTSWNTRSAATSH